MPRPTTRHRKPSRFASAPHKQATRRRKAPSSAPGPRRGPHFAAALAGSILAVSAGTAAAHWARGAHTATAGGQSLAVSAPPGGDRGSQGGRTPAIAPGTSTNSASLPPRAASGRATGPPSPAGTPWPAGHLADRGREQAGQPTAATSAYRDPFRDISGLLPERIDMGVDFGGSGPVYALGDAVVTNATADSAGWPGGGWITYRLTGGPAAGLMVFLAEDVTPAVQVGQHVSSATVIATMFDGGDGIETGWAQPDGFSAESQLPEAGGISGDGPFPTMIGLNFEELLQSLGAPAANNRTDPAYGVLPPFYPASWQ